MDSCLFLILKEPLSPKVIAGAIADYCRGDCDDVEIIRYNEFMKK